MSELDELGPVTEDERKQIPSKGFQSSPRLPFLRIPCHLCKAGREVISLAANPTQRRIRAIFFATAFFDKAEQHITVIN